MALNSISCVSCNHPILHIFSLARLIDDNNPRYYFTHRNFVFLNSAYIFVESSDSFLFAFDFEKQFVGLLHFIFLIYYLKVLTFEKTWQKNEEWWEKTTSIIIKAVSIHEKNDAS